MSWGHVNGLRGECSASCLCRLSMREQNDLGESVEALGLAIARFCRNARVGELQAKALSGAYVMASPASNYAYANGKANLEAALTELAALARGGGR